MAPSVWLFVFDAPHLTASSLLHTRDAVLTFLDDKWHDGDIGGVVFDGKMANNRLTSNKAELRAAVAALKMPGNERSVQIEMTREWPRFQNEDEVAAIAVTDDPTTLANVSARACDEEPDQCKALHGSDYVRSKAKEVWAELQRGVMSTLSVVDALSNGLARMSGPKTVVFFSDGFVSTKLEEEVRNAIGDAARAGAHFYAVDARGLDKGYAGSQILDQRLAGSLIGRAIDFDTKADGPNALAVDTGGFVIKNENNFDRALDQIARDASTYYVVGYSPTNATFDGKYRTIDVKVDKPGVKVRARRGYLALAPALMLRPEPAGGAGGLEGAKGAKGANGAKGAGANGAESAKSAGAEGAFADDAARSVPDLPVAPGAGPLAPAIPAGVGNASAANAVRARVEAGVLSLRKFDAADIGEGYADRGWLAYERGDLQTAASELSTASATDTRPWVFYALGYSQFAMRKYQAAADAWTRVRAAVPQFEPVYLDLADALNQQGDEKAALAVLQDAEKRWPNDVEVEDAIGVIEVRDTDLNAAVRAFERATTLAPNDPVGFFNLGRAYQMRYNRFRVYPSPNARRMADDDRERAVSAYTRYLDLHGPYEQQARDAIALLKPKD